MTQTNNQTTQEPVELKPKTTPSISDKDMVVLAHLSALLGFVFPLFAIGGPLAVYLLSSEKPTVQAHAKAALNFNITFTIAAFVAALSMFVVIGFLLLPVVGIVWLISIVLASIKASEGVEYKYPLTINFIK